MKKYLCLVVLSALFLNGCSYVQNLWPFSEDEQQNEFIQDDGAYLAVNPYLWQASLDSLAFMPLASTDAQGGVIVTEWKTMSHNEQFKVVVNIYTQDLRADSVKAEVYRRVLKNGLWIDDEADGHLSDELEKNILIRAKQLYYNDVAAR